MRLRRNRSNGQVRGVGQLDDSPTEQLSSGARVLGRMAAAAALLAGVLTLALPSLSSGAADHGVNTSVQGYRLVASDGGIFGYNATFYGSTGNLKLNQPIVGMAPTPDGGGYWLVASDGGIFTFGDATFYGSTGALKLNQPIVGMAATPDGGGYWLVAADGGIFTFGDATFSGSTGALKLNKPIVGMAATPDGGGYWLVAADGGIFNFGDATFSGSTGALKLNQPIVGMAATSDGGGYWLVASDGGIFNFGDATFYGSTGNLKLNKPIVGMAATPDGGGYWLVASDGGIFTFGDANYIGSTGGTHLNAPVVGMAFYRSTLIAPPPTVTALSPAQGPTGGGTVATLTGTNFFASGTTVAFGGVAAASVTVNSATSISATAPAGSGTVDVTVTTVGGTSATGAADHFTYQSISAVGSLADQVWLNNDPNTTSLPVSPQTVGDVLVVSVDSHATTGLTSPSGGGVTTWHKAVQFISARGHDIEQWYGTVTSTGSSNITFSWPTTALVWTEYVSQEFTAGLGAATAWSVDNGQAGHMDGPLDTNIPYPSLTATRSGELYYGYAGIPGTPTAGSTPGFAYGITAGVNIVTYNTATSGTVSPTASQSPAGLSETVGSILAASN